MGTAERKVAIIGGGIAGVTAARDLSKLGISSILVERAPFLGGHAVQYACKAAPSCQHCSACEVERALSEVASDEHVEVTTRSKLAGVHRSNGSYEVTIERTPARIDPARCTDCGLCLEACPAAAEGAISHSASVHVSSRYTIDDQGCLRLNGRDPGCLACVEACPVDAINLEAEAQRLDVTVDALVVATGFEPFDPATKPHLGYGTHPDIITALELEHTLRTRSVVTRPSNGGSVRKAAFVQCVGSRDKDHDYCSRACCGFALRMAEVLKERDPEVEVTVFYIDLQPVGKSFQQYYERCQADLQLRRTMVGDIYPLSSGQLRISAQDEETGMLVDEEFDLAVLSVGMSPGLTNGELSQLLGTDLDHCGFFRGSSPLDSTLTAEPGILLAGTVEGPRDIADTIAHAKRAAWHAAQMLGGL